MVSVGTIVWLSSELMFFAGLFAMYLTLRGVNPDIWAEDTQLLNVPFAAANTTILVLSSVTCQMGVFAAERGDRDRLRFWFTITFLNGTKKASEGSDRALSVTAESVIHDEFDKGLVRILIAEDNFINQKVCSGMLAKLGYTATIVGNGLEAVKQFEQQPYDQ